jgi:hypothetical protein
MKHAVIGFTFGVLSVMSGLFLLCTSQSVGVRWTPQSKHIRINNTVIRLVKQ